MAYLLLNFDINPINSSERIVIYKAKTIGIYRVGDFYRTRENIYSFSKEVSGMFGLRSEFSIFKNKRFLFKLNLDETGLTNYFEFSYLDQSYKIERYSESFFINGNGSIRISKDSNDVLFELTEIKNNLIFDEGTIKTSLNIEADQFNIFTMIAFICRAILTPKNI
ncbi:MAG: hypothetical protein H0W73_04735 [Bacteroidetes bacterium]|nr:hypothetical protein [Bacteroidota bacterium]